MWKSEELRMENFRTKTINNLELPMVQMILNTFTIVSGCDTANN